MRFRVVVESKGNEHFCLVYACVVTFVHDQSCDAISNATMHMV